LIEVMVDTVLELRTIEERFWFERVVVVGECLALGGISEEAPI
jgi:hypothetical protein